MTVTDTWMHSDLPASTSTETPIPVFVADDCPLFLEGLRSCTANDARFDLVGHAADGAATVDMCVRLQPAVALVNYDLPRLGRVALLEALTSQCPDTAIVVLSALVDSEEVHEAVALGARGYVVKQETGEKILAALYSVGLGDTAFSSAAASGLIDAVQRRASTSGALPSPRETEILHHLADGATAREIGTRLFISEATVKSHLHRLYEKLVVTDRAAAVAKAMRLGWLY